MRATPDMSQDTLLPFGFPVVDRKKVTAAFDGGRMTSDGGVMRLGAVKRRTGIARTLAAWIADPRNPLFVTHSVAGILRPSAAIPPASRAEPLAASPGCLPLPAATKTPTTSILFAAIPASSWPADICRDSGNDLCSQPTMSRWENAPDLRGVIRLSYAMVDIYCASYARPPRPVAVLLRPGKTPSGTEIRSHPRRRSLRAPRGDGVVRGERYRLHPGLAGQRRAGSPGGTGRRRWACSLRRSPGASGAWPRALRRPRRDWTSAMG